MVSAFVAFFCYLAYGASFDPPNYYLVLTRVPACLLVTYILFEISKDRGSAAKVAFLSVLVVQGVFLLIEVFDGALIHTWKEGLKVVVLLSAVVIGQGQLHQITNVVRSKSTGAISFRARTLNLMKDISTLVFAASMGTSDGWPLIVANGVNAVLTTVLLCSFSWYGEGRKTSEMG